MVKTPLEKKTVIILSLFLSFLPLSTFSQGTHLWNYNRLSEIKSNPSKYKKVYDMSLKRADRFASEPLLLITSKPAKFVSDTHYYVSLSFYYWPDPKNPGGPYIHKDGEKNPEYNSYDGRKFEILEDRLRSLSIAYYFTGSSKYRDAYLSQLRAWFIDKSTYMYPNLTYSQIAPGHDNNQGRPSGIIEGYQYTSIIESIRLVDSVSPIDSKTMKGVKKWFKLLGKWLRTSKAGILESQSISNHGFAYDVLLLDIDLFCTGKLNTDLVSSLSNRLQIQIDRDGKQPEELKRASAMTYSIYNLEHVVDLCLLMESSGNSYYQSHKSIIDSAFNYLIQFIGRQSSFPYKENRDWKGLESKLKREYNRLPRRSSDSIKTNLRYDFSQDVFDIFK